MLNFPCVRFAVFTYADSPERMCACVCVRACEREHHIKRYSTCSRFRFLVYQQTSEGVNLSLNSSVQWKLLHQFDVLVWVIQCQHLQHEKKEQDSKLVRLQKVPLITNKTKSFEKNSAMSALIFWPNRTEQSVAKKVVFKNCNFSWFYGARIARLQWTMDSFCFAFHDDVFFVSTSGNLRTATIAW